ncbi:FecR domain-containing protein [Fibrobacter sp. UWR1]|uniref:FecR family protein n=1 Tax=Fibrobacter sp. UWR1 TaxID=2135645 RepID=UPI000DADF535|nr:FecR family protein [Fibrobacter sp. UWR1]PZW69322.1 FecR family protein [Fibrobacter sp. UWR1]
MTFSKYFKAISLFIAVLACFSAAKSGSGKITFTLGDPQIMKYGKSDWKSIRQSGKKVNQFDKIRTVLEEQVIISLPDGSSLTIDENSLVEIPELLSEDGVNNFSAEIKKGRVKFSVQKQANAKSSIKFSTGTATAAIRGTEGVFAELPNGMAYASLHEGALELTIGNKSYTIGGGQTLLPGADGTYQVVELAASGEMDFLKEVEGYFSDSTVSLDSIIKLAKEKDSKYTEMLNTLKDSLQCNTSNLPDTIRENSVTLKAICKPGINVTIAGQTIASTGEEISVSTGWASDTEGDKKFPLTCSVNNFTADCGLLKTYFKAVAEDTVKKDTVHVHNKLELTSGPVINVCEKGLATVEGTFDPSDPSASLRVSVGKKSSETNLLLLFSNGKFNYSIPVNDKIGNWNEKQIKVEYESNTFGKETATAELSINKSCPDVNITAPSITFIAADEIKCSAELKVGEANGDIVILTPYLDGAPMMDKTFQNDGKATVNLATGIHDYNFQVTDQAGHKSSISRKLGCYPVSDKFSISLRNGPYERLRVPRPPPGASTILYRNLHFTINGMTENDPVYIKEIAISQQDKKKVIIKGSSLQSNSVDHQVELSWGTKVTVNIDVIMKNGAIIKASKTFDATSSNTSKSSEVK